MSELDVWIDSPRVKLTRRRLGGWLGEIATESAIAEHEAERSREIA